MTSKDKDVIYVAITSGSAVLADGREFSFRQGQTRIKGDHPLMGTTNRVHFEPYVPPTGVTDKYIQR